VKAGFELDGGHGKRMNGYLLFLMGGLAAAAGVRIHDFFEGENLLRDIWDEYRISHTRLDEMDERWASHPERSEAIVSLTTIPSRLPLIEDTLKSLMRQSRVPARIHLNVPAFSKRENCPYVIPEELRRLKSVEIVATDDWGPATKLIPTLLSQSADRMIIVVDDDRIYPANLVCDLENAARIGPGAAYGFSGWVVPDDLIDRPTTVMSNLLMKSPAPIRSTRLRRPIPVDVLQGLSGYLVQPRFFDMARVTDYAGAPREAFFVDDVWISAHCKADKFVIAASRSSYSPKRRVRFYTRTGLGVINRGSGSLEARSNTVMIRHCRKQWRTGGRSVKHCPKS